MSPFRVFSSSFISVLIILHGMKTAFNDIIALSRLSGKRLSDFTKKLF